MKLQLSEIIILDGRRDIDHDKVSELAESIRIVGLINPITVRKDYTLVAGAHRLEACRLLGFDKIECVILDCDELRSELAEIDENFVRNDLDDISIGELAIRRDEILDVLGLRARSGGTGANQYRSRGADSAPLRTNDDIKSYGDSAGGNELETTESIAKEMGVSERALQVNKQLAKNLVPEAKEAVREKSIPKSAAIEISRLKPKEQREVVAKNDKKAIMAELQKKKQQTKGGGSASPRKKTIAKTEVPEHGQYIIMNLGTPEPITVNFPLPENDRENKHYPLTDYIAILFGLDDDDLHADDDRYSNRLIEMRNIGKALTTLANIIIDLAD